MRMRTAGAAALLVLLAAAGCTTDGPTPKPQDPWEAAGVDSPKITTSQTNGTTTVSVDAVTTLPLHDSKNEVGFGKRAAKITWRNHLGGIDVLNVAIRDGDGHSNTRTWQRAELQDAFGPRLPGLDDGRTPPRPAANPDGPLHGHKATALPDAETLLDGLVTTSSREVLGTDPTLEGTSEDECESGLTGKDTGETRHTADFRVAVAGPPVTALQRLADHWAAQGLTVDVGGLLRGTEDRIRADLEGVGWVSAEETADPSRLRVQRGTGCLKP
ncbi:hypothetical protein [Actinocorallia sp. A-T 12471]|uniref:hypothetical protein n=1 Tax=Actinocorallia sp. A-T 12471 TaxID=3089813 RepID=UPI0029D3DF82|nr:hypothetical protein [Actinocorallia sp. A-T 12471]MDX6738448.1 hypothetical protein [Actinocorallia sp. A-T 12471]